MTDWASGGLKGHKDYIHHRHHFANKKRDILFVVDIDVIGQ